MPMRGPIRPSRRAQPRAAGQLPLDLPIAQPSARTITWVPGDPVHPAPEHVDPDPRPAVLADDTPQPDEDAAHWHPGLLETGRRRGRPGPVVGRPPSVRGAVTADHCSPPPARLRSLVDDQDD